MPKQSRNMTLGIPDDLMGQIDHNRRGGNNVLSKTAYVLAVLGTVIPRDRPVFRKAIYLVEERGKRLVEPVFVMFTS